MLPHFKCINRFQRRGYGSLPLLPIPGAAQCFSLVCLASSEMLWRKQIGLGLPGHLRLAFLGWVRAWCFPSLPQSSLHLQHHLIISFLCATQTPIQTTPTLWSLLSFSCLRRSLPYCLPVACMSGWSASSHFLEQLVLLVPKFSISGSNQAQVKLCTKAFHLYWTQLFT